MEKEIAASPSTSAQDPRNDIQEKKNPGLDKPGVWGFKEIRDFRPAGESIFS